MATAVAGEWRAERATITDLLWSHDQLHIGLPLLTQRVGLSSPLAVEKRPLSTPHSTEDESLTHWFTTATAQLGCAVQAIQWQFSDIPQLVQQVAPAILKLPQQESYLLLLKGGLRRVTLLSPDQQLIKIAAQQLVTYLQTAASGRIGQQVERLLTRSGVSAARLPKARAALVGERLSGRRFSECWLLKVASHSPVWQHIRHNHLPRHLLILISISLVQQLFTIISWRYIGQGVFRGSFSEGSLDAWALILLSGIPLTMLASWAQINLSLNMGRWSRSRMLYGILNLNPSDIRHLGAGQFLERVMQTESFQTLVLSSGFAIITAIMQVIFAAFVLRRGVGGNLHSLMLIIWLLLTLGLSLGYALLFVRWRDTYRALTNDLVERMVAHRTRLAQEDKTTWHREEDQRLDHFHKLSKRLDDLQLTISTLLNRGWFIIGLAGIAVPFIHGADNKIWLAVSIGGIMLASRAFSSLTGAVVTIANIFATWRDVAPIFRAATQATSVGKSPTIPTMKEKRPLLIAQNLQFRYSDTAPLTLKDADLTIYPRDRILLEGPSGGGKSTLASLLTGLQQPNSGLLLLHGLDQPTLGLSNWRRRVVSAPQFHENHVFAETFGFNLLMGRRWPATPKDTELAEQICEELGLGDLIERMPGGMMQMVGESGWQLSHGERSRLFIARALLQEADMIVLDESFAALDPANLERAITCVLKRAPTLLVIAHP